MNWISVKDKLPESDGVYIIYAENGDFSQLNTAYYDGMFWHLAPHYRNHVTHWMHLPEPPKNEATVNISPEFAQFIELDRRIMEDVREMITETGIIEDGFKLDNRYMRKKKD